MRLWSFFFDFISSLFLRVYSSADNITLILMIIFDDLIFKDFWSSMIFRTIVSHKLNEFINILFFYNCFLFLGLLFILHFFY